MAYANLLAAVEKQQVDDYRYGHRPSLTPSKTVSCSHLIAYWVSLQPLGKLLHEALDGGEPLRHDLWHPFRVPTIHWPPAVRQLHSMLANAWEQALREKGVPEQGDWYAEQIAIVMDLFHHASIHEMCVASLLEPPFDEERARKVVIPLAP